METQLRIGIGVSGILAMALSSQTAFAVTVPATIEAEAFTNSYDSDTVHEGDCGTGPVDQEITTDVNGGTCHVSNTLPGEWLEYPITVATTASFDIRTRLAATTAMRTVVLSIDGVHVGTATSPAGGLGAFQDATVSGVSITAGDHTLRATFLTGGVNINYLKFEAAAGGPITQLTANCKGGIAITADGNTHNADQWGSSALMLASLAKANHQGYLVHFDYNNHIWGGPYDDALLESESSALGMADSLGYNPAIFFNSKTNQSGATASLTAAINASTSTSRLCVLLAGPIKVLYDAMVAATSTKRANVTIVSHSLTNEGHAATHSGPTWASLQALGPTTVAILAGSLNGALTDWGWLADEAYEGDTVWMRILRAADGCSYATISTCSAGDLSDLSMIYYIYTGVTNGSATPAAYKTWWKSHTVRPFAPAHFKIQGESFIAQSGTTTVTTTDPDGGGTEIQSCDAGDYLKYSYDFKDGMRKMTLRVASGTTQELSYVELWADSTDPDAGGVHLGTCEVDNTGSWSTWTDVVCPVSSITGQHDFFLQLGSGGTNGLMNINWIRFEY